MIISLTPTSAEHIAENSDIEVNLKCRT